MIIKKQHNALNTDGLMRRLTLIVIEFRYVMLLIPILPVTEKKYLLHFTTKSSIYVGIALAVFQYINLTVSGKWKRNTSEGQMDCYELCEWFTDPIRVCTGCTE